MSIHGVRTAPGHAGAAVFSAGLGRRGWRLVGAGGAKTLDQLRTASAASLRSCQFLAPPSPGSLRGCEKTTRQGR
eukprot:CAMPEP_0204446402 /NCGR_PEP_ID=MMETSP0470-20130426/94653_1 /ASSEMBLY_ACC=CAM_ASM_000385 /TAXON_ID=2969 /ORGANISM="Oxyrrhis marina" /LENGTH=74 /DNA_ID=CAMNT_0051445977 /DNA_START=51 /DNA_END=272 /DNA_ORIENTATION=-